MRVERRGDDWWEVSVLDDLEMSTAIVLAVAGLLDVDAVALTPPLTEVLSPDLLDDLFAGTMGSGETVLQFESWGCRVTVSEATRIRVERVDG